MLKTYIFSLSLAITFSAFFSPLHTAESKTLHFDFPALEKEEEGVTVNFSDISLLEFIRFVSKIVGANFVYDEKILDFNVSLVSGKPTHPQNIFKILVELLNQQGIKIEKKDSYYLVEKMEGIESIKTKKEEVLLPITNGGEKQTFLPAHELPQKPGEFFIYKIQYHQGSEIQEAIKKVAADLKSSLDISPDLAKAVSSMQWVRPTNSILYSGSEKGINELTTLIKSLDVPKKQVFIEILVIETDVKNGLEFGLEWGGGGKYRNKVGYGVGNFPATPGQSPFAHTLQQINATNTPTGTSQIPIGRGFDLGVIGDIILHKGASYFSLGSLVSALQSKGDTTIILNQKIITQDNKPSTIFVGDNIPFTGSVIQTVGASQQTSANIEYRDVGVKLNITPLLGEGDMITLDISEEITEARNDLLQATSSTVNGILTTKTDMSTQVHVPDKSFLVLSGMIRNTKQHQKSGLPCLGGLPLIGAAFSKTKTNDEKRNIIIFVRPQIIHSNEEHHTITASQEKEYKKQAKDLKEFQKALDMVNKDSNT